MFEPLLAPARYKGAKGGRGSGKSRFFAALMVEDCLLNPGLRFVCVREMQKSLKESAKRLIEDTLNAYNVGAEFDVTREEIRTPGGGVGLFIGMQDHTAESVKSLEGFDRAWIEEAQSLSDRSLSLLRPTIRAPGSEIWASWNPRRKTDAIDEFLVSKRPEGAVVVHANWRDNPWFTPELEAERQLDLKLYPDRYEHIWEGAYASAFEGAYYANLLAEARREGRIGKVGRDPLLPIRSYHDIGGAGRNADAYVIWVCQFVGREIRLLDYYEAQGQVLGAHAAWLRERWGEATHVILPHDGASTNAITGARYQDHWKQAGFTNVRTIPNQGPGAARARIEAFRRLGPQMWFNEADCAPGIEALGYYHERKDESRNIGLGPEHDWSSHAADAAGLMAVDYQAPGSIPSVPRRKQRAAWAA